jgi:hypothetical protein
VASGAATSTRGGRPVPGAGARASSARQKRPRPPGELPWGLSAFGLRARLGFCVPGASPASGPAGRSDLRVSSVAREQLEPLACQPRRLRYLQSFDGMPYAMLEGTRGDVLLHCGEQALMHLDADLGTLRCAPSPGADLRWQRALTDTVLWTASLLRGFELLHASTVSTDHGLIALAGASGSGKSTLAAEFVRRGARPFCDDLLALEDRAGRLIGHPGPPLMSVPRALEPPQGADVTVIATFAEERWVQFAHPAPAPAPVAAVVLLAAGAARSRCETLAASNLELLPLLIGFPHLDGRARRRFELSALLASQARLVRLRRALDASPSELVDMIQAELERR